jgi:hypothetical protein
MVKIALMVTVSMALKAAIAAKAMASTGSMTTVTGSKGLVDYSVMVTVESKDDWVSTVTYNRNLAQVPPERYSRKDFACTHGPRVSPSLENHNVIEVNPG